MRQKTGFEAWFDASRADVARVFTNLGEGLEDGQLNWEAISIDVPESVEVEIECGADGDEEEYEFEFSMSWDASAVDEATVNGTGRDDAETESEEETAAVKDGGSAQGGTPDRAPATDREGPARPAEDAAEPGDEDHPADRSF